MYLLYESLYGDLLEDCDCTDIIGLYETRKQAIEKAKELINIDLKNNYVLDIESDNIEENNFVRLFYNNQENWNCYYEIIIKKVNIE